jgi:hypothetical protein
VAGREAARGSGVRSHLADGRTVTWEPSPGTPGRAAVDAELADQDVPRALGARFPAEAADPRAFWRSWTRAETLAKLAGVPILVWLTRHGLQPCADGSCACRRAALTTTVIAAGGTDVVVTCGYYPG